MLVLSWHGSFHECLGGLKLFKANISFCLILHHPDSWVMLSGVLFYWQSLLMNVCLYKSKTYKLYKSSTNWINFYSQSKDYRVFLWCKLQYFFLFQNFPITISFNSNDLSSVIGGAYFKVYNVTCSDKASVARGNVFPDRYNTPGSHGTDQCRYSFFVTMVMLAITLMNQLI
jgi:hypothetical protein